jgi:coenzyme F420-reducing hydrogenase delta subunit
MDSISNKVTKFESELQALLAAQEEIRETMKGWMEQIQVGEYERNQRLENWRRLLDEHTDTMEKFSKEWITFSDQYKEAKMAVQTLSDWQDQLEQQQREASELLRVESHRMQSRWDNFLLENEKKWKNFELETEQRWATVNRHEKQIQEQVNALEETLSELQQEKDLIRRVQTAQSDAIKQLPRIWLEEVEKAISQNPNRRRQPALVPVREE